MNTHFDENATDIAENLERLKKLDRYRREQKISGLTYSVVVFGSLFANFIFTIIVSIIATKLYPTLSIQDALLKIQKMTPYPFWTFAVIPIFSSIAIASICLFFKRKPADFGLQRCKPIYPLLSIVLAIGMFLGLSWVNTLFLRGIHYTAPDVTPRLDGGYFLLAVLIIAVVPAVIEEVIFRGMLLNGLKKNGTLYACMVSGILFSIFHMNPAQTIYQFFCGVLFSYITIKAGSILPAILLHFLNNFMALVNMKWNLIGTGNAWIQEYSAVHIVILVLSLLLLVGAVAVLVVQDVRAHKNKRQTIELVEGKQRAFQVKKGEFWLYAFAGVLGAVAMWLTMLFSTFLQM